MKRIPFYLLLQALSVILFTACSDDSSEPAPAASQPATYSFTNVDYSGQTTRMDMLEEMTVYMKKANDTADQTIIMAKTLKDMFANANAPFAVAALNTSGKQLQDKCPDNTTVQQFLTWMDEFEAAHQAAGANGKGSKGVAGVVSSKSGTKHYFCDAKGFEHIQLIEKGLMGAVFYYQTTSVYTAQGKIGAIVDNDSVVAGKGTDKQHHWDEAYGYFGASNDFPQDVSNLRFHAKYCNARDPLTGLNKKIMDEGFIKGRFAINQKDDTKLDEAVKGLRKRFEQVVAATALYYLNAAASNISDDALRNHALSEAYAFIWSLKFNLDKNLTDAQVDALLTDLGTDFYVITQADIIKVRDALAAKFPELEPNKANF